MEFSNSNLILAGVCVKLGYSWVKNWMAKGDLKRRYIQAAAEQIHQVEETYHIADNLIIDDVTESAVVVTPEVRRRVRHKGLFRSYLVQQGKAKFGTPERTKANELCVRKYLYDECREHGVLPRHIVENLNFAVEVVFLPSREEILAKAVRHTKLYQARVDLSRDMEVPTSFD